MRPGIVGSWTATDDENELLIFNFFNDGTYTHAEVDYDDPDEESGMGWGDYSRDPADGRLTVTHRFDSNGDTGLTDFVMGNPQPQAVVFMNVEDDELAVTTDNNGDGTIEATIRFARTTSDGLDGTWLDRSTASDSPDLLLLNFLNDGTYVHYEIESGATASDSSGMEWSGYSRDAETSLLDVEPVVPDQTGFDENNGLGLTDFIDPNMPPNVFAFANGSVLELEIDEDGDDVTDATIAFDRQ